MDNHYEYILDSGIVTPDTKTVLEQVESEWSSAFSNKISTDPSTPQGRIIEIEAKARSFAINLCALVANQINIENATGQFLDALGIFFGMTRNAASRTRVLAVITGDVGTYIPKGTLAKTLEGDMFYLENETTIGAGEVEYVSFLSQEMGPIPAGPKSLTTMVTQISGWESVTNDTLGNVGRDRESDFDFRKRIKQSRYQGVSIIGNIKSALNKVQNIRSHFIYNNGSNETVVYQNIPVLPHSILAVIDGGDDDEIAEAIFKSLSAGCDMTHIKDGTNVTKEVEGEYGVKYDIKFNRPTKVPVSVKITITNNGFSGQQIEDAVANAIVNWAAGSVPGLDSYEIGDSISPFEIANAVTSQMPTIYINDLQIARGEEVEGGEPLPYGSTALKFTIDELGVINSSNIKVKDSTDLETSKSGD